MTQNERISLPLWWKLLLLFFGLILFALQIALIWFSVDLYIQDTFYGAGLIYIISQIASWLVILFVIRRHMPTNYKLTWCILILIFPIPFSSLYFLNQASKHLSSKSYEKHKYDVPVEIDDEILMKELKIADKKAYNMALSLKKTEDFTLYKNIKYTYYKDALLKHQDMMESLKSAKKYIYIETFILAEGTLLDELYPILKECGENGVEIKILYDDLGSKGRLHHSMIKRITEIKNCKLASYQPVGFNFNLLVNYRDHRKVCIIDGKVCYCGGDNLADEYIHERERFGFWRDTCGKYEGGVTLSFTRMFLSTWYRVTKEKIEMPVIEMKEHPVEGFIMPFWDGPTNNLTPAYDLFFSLIESAENYVYISTPYFVVDDAMIELLVRKIKEGVDVKILMPHIPDKKTAFYMGRLNYRDLYKAGGVVYEFTKGFNHSKAIIVDDKYAFMGTINMDYRSLFLHYECGCFIIKNPEVLKMKEDFDSVIKESLVFDYELWHKKKWYERLIGYIFSIFAPMF